MGNKKSSTYNLSKGISDLNEEGERKILEEIDGKDSRRRDSGRRDSGSFTEEYKKNSEKDKSNRIEVEVLVDGVKKKKKYRKKTKEEKIRDREERKKKEAEYEKMKMENELLRQKQEELERKISSLEDEKSGLKEEKEKIAKAFINKASEFNSKLQELSQEKTGLNQKLSKLEASKLKSMKSRSKRAGLLRQFYISEKQYVDKLKLLKDYYVHPISKNHLMNEESMTVIFHNFLKLVQKNGLFLKELERVLFVGSSDDFLLDLFLKFFDDGFDEYFGYIKGFSGSFREFKENWSSKKRFRKFLNKMSKMLKKREKISSLIGLMLLPVQRLERYKKVVEDLKRFTPSDDEKHEKQHTLLSKVLDKINEHIELRDSIEKKSNNEFLNVLKIVQINVQFQTTLDPLQYRVIHQTKCKRDFKEGKKKTTIFVLNGILIAVHEEKDEDGESQKIVEPFKLKKTTEIKDNHALLEVQIDFKSLENEGGFRVKFDDKSKYKKFVKSCRTCLD